ALARAARSLMTVAIGLVPVLLISGFVEAFVTPSGLPAAVRIAIGAGVWIAFLVYMLGRGRQVHGRGITGDLSEEMVGDQVATAGRCGPRPAPVLAPSALYRRPQRSRRIPPRPAAPAKSGEQRAPRGGARACQGRGRDDSDHPILGWVGIPGPAGRHGAQEAMVG